MKSYPSTESKTEQVERVRQMATSDGDGEIWDLSVNDCAALEAVLADREALLAALQAITFRFAVVCAATGEFDEANAKALDAASVAMQHALGEA